MTPRRWGRKGVHVWSLICRHAASSSFLQQFIHLAPHVIHHSELAFWAQTLQLTLHVSVQYGYHFRPRTIVRITRAAVQREIFKLAYTKVLWSSSMSNVPSSQFSCSIAPSEADAKVSDRLVIMQIALRRSLGVKEIKHVAGSRNLRAKGSVHTFVSQKLQRCLPWFVLWA